MPGVPHLMNFVLLTAVLSAANSGIYATTRTLYSMAERGEAPSFVRRLSKKGVPLGGIALTTSFLAVGIVLAYLSPAQIINQLMSIPGFTICLVWIAICAAELKLRKNYKKLPFFKIAGFPYVTLIGLISLSLIFISFVLNRANLIGTLTCLVIMAFLVIVSFLVHPQANSENRDLS